MGGGQNADMLKTLSEFGEGKSPQEMLPLLMSMMSKSTNATPAAGSPPASAPVASAPSPSSPAGKGQFFFPILDFAGEQIIYHLSLLLR